MKMKLLALLVCLAAPAFAQESDPINDPVGSSTSTSTVTTETTTEWVMSYRYGPTYTVNGKTANDLLGATVTKITITKQLVNGQEIKRESTRETRNVIDPLKVWFTNAATNTAVIVIGPGKVNRHADAPSRLFKNASIPAEE